MVPAVTPRTGDDGANRLDLASEGAAWTRDYTYDRFGNRGLAGGGISFNASDNRITGGGYDAAGNLTALANVAASMSYDANNKMTAFVGPNGACRRKATTSTTARASG